MCADGVASLTGLAGIVDALMTPRNRFSGFTMAFLVFDLAAFGLSFTSLSVIVVRISTNVGMPLDGDKSNSNTDSVSYNWIVLLLNISEVLADFILVLLNCHFYSTLYPRVHSCFQIETIDDVGNNDEIEMRDMVQQWVARHSEMPGIQPPCLERIYYQQIKDAKYSTLFNNKTR
ncbi:uncharacterized protein LOC132915966 [Bombus pascuorum]|nr:uncharacterized protein LOC132915608 [Bombus pascuorum]XP_060831710.1 uncharacterized protein LOC132915966 [Bombus pascuorum]